MAKENDNKIDDLKEKLFYNPKHAAQVMDDAEIKRADEYCEEYKAFLNYSKTEREATEYAVNEAVKNGFAEFEIGMKLKAGDKVFCVNRDKSIALAIVGNRPATDGISIVASHIDSPRLDLKQRPLYEDGGFAYFDTHYYGGIKKYQWTAVPLSLHGVVVRSDGSQVIVNIGEDENDPVFCVTDLLPHLAAEQMKRTAIDLIKGEDLNVLIGSRPFNKDEGSDLVKLNIMNILFEKYDIIEKDFLSAELEVVPAYKAKDVGFDRSIVGGYGQDDRVCAYPSLTAIFEAGVPEFTTLVYLADKEEVGSDGVTGTQSAFLRFFIEDLAIACGMDSSSGVRHVLSNSVCLSADVNVGFDPLFPEVVERRNCTMINGGVAMMKYSGSRGKAGTSDANAELVAKVGKIFDDADVLWQIGELGKVDQGGGGTVAMYIANLNVDTIDVGVPVLSMHSPFELASKLDIYMAHKAFLAFINRK